MKREKIIGLYLFLFVIVSLVFVVAEDSEGPLTEWRMKGRWLNHTSWDGSNFNTIWGSNLANFTVGSSTESSPAVANGFVYIGGLNAQFYQLNASNISQKIANFTVGNNFVSSAAVVNGFVYVCTVFEGNQMLQLNASNVSIKYANFSLDSGGCVLSPAVANGFVYIGSYDGMFFQLNASNVSQKIANFTTGILSRSSPAVANGFVYIGDLNNYVYQLNASNISQKIANFTTGNDVRSSPAVANGFVYIGGSDGQMYQLNASNISIKYANFTIVGNDIISSPAVANGFVYIGAENNTYQLNASNISQKIANFTVPAYFKSSPTVANSFVYIGSHNGQMYQLNASNVSQKIANFTTGSSIISTNAYAEGYLYFPSYDGQLYQILAANISDQKKPEVTINSPSTGTYTNSGSISIDIATNEAGSCNYTLDSGGSFTTLTANSSSTGFTGTQSFSNQDYNLTAYCLDLTGNGNSTQSVTFSVNVASTSGDRSNRNRGYFDYIKIYDISSNLSKGYTGFLSVGEKYAFVIEGENHTLTLNSFNSVRAKVTINSTPIVSYLAIGQNNSFDLNGDGDEDLRVNYKGISSGKAVIYAQSLIDTVTITDDANTSSRDNWPYEGISRTRIAMIIIASIILIVIGIKRYFFKHTTVLVREKSTLQI